MLHAMLCTMPHAISGRLLAWPCISVKINVSISYPYSPMPCPRLVMADCYWLSNAENKNFCLERQDPFLMLAPNFHAISHALSLLPCLFCPWFCPMLHPFSHALPLLPHPMPCLYCHIPYLASIALPHLPHPMLCLYSHASFPTSHDLPLVLSHTSSIFLYFVSIVTSHALPLLPCLYCHIPCLASIALPLLPLVKVEDSASASTYWPGHYPNFGTEVEVVIQLRFAGARSQYVVGTILTINIRTVGVQVDLLTRSEQQTYQTSSNI